jgi:8-oxo-dGTP diphosphatase
MSTKLEMVVGFLFSVDGQLVALLHKQHGPEAIVDKLNGIGGKIEPGETPQQAMQREFIEEAGLNIDSWEQFARLEAGNWIVHVFRAFAFSVVHAHTRTDEEVMVTNTFNPEYEGVPRVENLKWLLPLALDKRPIGITQVYY